MQYAVFTPLCDSSLNPFDYVPGRWSLLGFHATRAEAESWLQTDDDRIEEIDDHRLSYCACYVPILDNAPCWQCAPSSPVQGYVLPEKQN